MANRRSENAKNGEIINPRRISTSATIAAKGVNTTLDVANLMRALISDIATDSIAPQKANAICNAAGKMLKTAEVEFKWKTSDGGKGKPLTLASGS